MTHPSELERPKDSLAKVVAELRDQVSKTTVGAKANWFEAMADRIERLDAENDADIERAAKQYNANIERFLVDIAALRAELDACKSLLADPPMEKIRAAMRAYLPPGGMTSGAFIDRVLEIADPGEFMSTDDNETPHEPEARNDVSTPRPTDCEDIRSGEVVVLDRDADGRPSMTMVKK
jgi:hypothetical protein